MRHILNTDRLSRNISVPFCTPQVELMRNDCLVLGMVKIPQSHTLRVRWVTLHIISLLTQGNPVRVNSGLGLCYVGLFGPVFEDAQLKLVPSGVPLVSLSTDTVGARATNPYDYTDVSSPGSYLVAVVNNMTNGDVSVTVSGMSRLFCQTND